MKRIITDFITAKNLGEPGKNCHMADFTHSSLCADIQEPRREGEFPERKKLFIRTNGAS